MKIRGYHVGVALAVGLGAGWLARGGALAAGGAAAGHGGDESDAGKSARFEERPARERRAQFGPRSAALREELKRAKPEMLPQLVRQALEGADPAERMALVLEMFSAVDASNAAEVMAAFGEISRDSGRTHAGEWLLACYLTGQRAGEPMMERVMEMGLRDNYAEAHQTFFGWASADPAMAEKWLDGLAGDELAAKPELMRAVMGGLAIKDPAAALQRLGELQEPLRSKCLGDVTFHLVQGQGIDRAIDWMLEVNSRAEPADREYADRVREDILGKLFWSGSGRGGGANVAEQLERIHGTVPIDGQRIVQEAEKMRGMDGLEMIDRLSRGPILADPQVRDQAIRVALERARQRNAAQTEAWLRDHPESAVSGLAKE